MEGRLRRLLLLAGLLAALLPAAAANFGPQQPGAPCEPTLLATQVSLFCAPDMPTAQCCEPVVAAVDLGGGVPCLCRVAAEPQLVMAGLNATHLLALYSSCGGLRPGGAHLAAACEGPAPPGAIVFAPPPSPAPRRKQPAHEAPPPPPQIHDYDGGAHLKAFATYVHSSKLSGPQPGAACEPTLLATQISRSCVPDMRTAQCCEPVIAAVDLGGGVPCLCRVAAEPQLVMAGLNATHLLALYSSCGGLRPGGAHLAAACEGPAPAAAVFAPPASPEPRRKHLAQSAPLDAVVHSAQAPLRAPHLKKYISTHVSTLEIEELPCNFPKLAADISDNCGSNIPNSTCCTAVVAAVDIGACFCKVISQESIITSPITGVHLIFLYDACGGLRPISRQIVRDCESPLPGLAKNETEQLPVVNCTRVPDVIDIYHIAKANTIILAINLFLLLGLISALGWLWIKTRRYAATNNVLSRGGLPVNRIQPQANTAASSYRPRLTQSEGDVNPVRLFLTQCYGRPIERED